MCASIAQAEKDAFQENLKKVRWMESSVESKAILEYFDGLTDSQLTMVSQRADETGNIDLLNIIRQKVEGERRLLEIKTWSESLDINSRLSFELEVLVKKNSSIKLMMKEYFLNAPDVPYDQIHEWHRGYGYRGLQGVLLKIMAQYYVEGFREVVEMINSEATSHSRKKTIIWSMRYDASGFSERILRAEIAKMELPFHDEMTESLQFLEQRKQSYTVSTAAE